MSELTITGPYQYEGELHPSLRIDAPDRIVATVYVVDNDIERAWREATAMTRAADMLAVLTELVDQMDHEDTGEPGMSARDYLAKWQHIHETAAALVASPSPSLQQEVDP